VTLVFRFDAALADVQGVSRTIELREDQTLADLHETIREAFGWLDDHLYSFWLDGRFWGDHSTEYTAPVEAEEGVRTADVPVSGLGLERGARIAYLFDFGDEWRVELRMSGTGVADGGRYPRIVASKGEAPPQYPDLEGDELE
jgi:pRiA4b ORF-3-like protein